MPQASWERRHPGQSESWSLDFCTVDASLGGFVALTFHPARRRCWYWAALVGEGRPYLLVRDLEVGLPRLPASREIRAEALWADMNCETPFEHWSLGLEAFGVAMDDPGEALGAERGERVGLGLDLEWEAVGALLGGEGSYDQPGIVHGEVLVGSAGVETIAFQGRGWRRHAWGEDAWSGMGAAPMSWLGGWLDDGTPHLLRGVDEDVAVQELRRAPLLVEAGAGAAGGGTPVPLERWLCTFIDPRAGPGSGWVEWLRPH